MKTIGSRIHDCFNAPFIAVFLSSCTTPQQQASDSAVRQRHDLERGSLAAAFERLGSRTIYDHTARASELGGEFYTPINARFPLNDPASRHVFIREVRWQHGDRYVAVFCTRQRGAWFVFEAVEWHRDVVF